jgi:hypothetical protein
MKFIIETVSGRKGIKNFNDLYEYIDFMTNNGDKIRTIKESELPYQDKPVKLSDTTKSEGWQQVDNSAFGDINSEGKKGSCVLPNKKETVFKNDVKFEGSKSKEEKNDANISKVEKSSVKNNNEGSENEIPKFQYNESVEELDEDFKDKFSKAKRYAKGAVAGAAMAGSLAGNVHAQVDPYYDGATNPSTEYNEPYDYEETDVYSDEDPYYDGATNPNTEDNHYDFEIKKRFSDGSVLDAYGNHFSKEEYEKLRRGIDPYYESANSGCSNKKLSKDLEEEIAEALRIAGVELDESDCSEDVGSEADMEVEPKTGKAKLFEKEPEIEEGCK